MNLNIFNSQKINSKVEDICNMCSSFYFAVDSFGAHANDGNFGECTGI